MDYRDQIERLKQRSGLVVNRLAGYLPGSLVQVWSRSERPLRWGMVGAAIGGGLYVVLIPLYFLVTVFSNPAALFQGLSLLLVAGVFSALNFGLLAYCVGLRSKQERVGAIVLRVIIGYMIGTLIPIIGLTFPYLAIFFWGMKFGVTRGTQLTSAPDLQRYLRTTEANYLRQRNLTAIEPKFQIGGVELPNYLESLGCCMVGAPGSGKTQAIKGMLHTMRHRPDFRAMVLDRNGELLEEFFRSGEDLIFNPTDTRSVAWSHRSEEMRAETLAAALVPDDPKDRFFSEAAKSLLADLYERCENNAEIWEVITEFSMEDLANFLSGGVSARYFKSENTGASVLSTMVNEMRFYRALPEVGAFSFSDWGRKDDPRWLFLPIFEDDAERFRPLYTMAFEMMLKGLLSQENRNLKTALVIDELGALNQLRSLPRLLAEARKFGGTALLGTQTTAQIERVYGKENSRIVLQGTATKLILNCRDEETSEQMAKIIGRQERVDIVHGSSMTGLLSRSHSKTETIRETYAVMPSELQALPPLAGYLNIADGSPPAKVTIEPRSYPKQADRLIADPTAKADTQQKEEDASDLNEGGVKRFQSLKEFKSQKSAQHNGADQGIDHPRRLDR